jgi:hypothetical protein
MSNNIRVAVDIETVSQDGSQIGFVAQASATADEMIFVLYNGTSERVELWHRNSGTNTLLGSVESVRFPVGTHYLLADFYDGQISVFIEGIRRIGPVTDPLAASTSRRIGIRAPGTPQTATSGYQVSRFEAFAAGSTPPSTGRVFTHSQLIIHPAQAAPPPPVFDPSSIAGLKLWLKADAITGKVDGDLLDQWNDSSGNGYHAAASGAARPTYKTNVINGLPSVRFAGAQLMTTTTWNNLAQASSRALFIVARATDATGAFSQYLVLSLDSKYGQYINSAGNLIGTIYTLATVDVNAGAAVDNEFFQVDQRHRFVTGDAAHRFQTKRNGGTLADNGVHGTTTASSAVTIGGRSGVSRYLTGDICEILAYNADFTDTNRADVRTYLANKYGLTP